MTALLFGCLVTLHRTDPTETAYKTFKVGTDESTKTAFEEKTESRLKQ